jgi:hypothetical protein
MLMTIAFFKDPLKTITTQSMGKAAAADDSEWM